MRDDPLRRTADRDEDGLIYGCLLAGTARPDAAQRHPGWGSLEGSEHLALAEIVNCLDPRRSSTDVPSLCSVKS